MERPRTPLLVGLASVSAGLFAARGLHRLFTRHPHEDAYILFRYAEHLGEGLGIVYNPQGPPAEGATDFLWMVALGALHAAGADVAVAAVALNALGAGLLTVALARLQPAAGLVLAPLVPFLAGAHAAVEGFGTLGYCGLVALGASLVATPHTAARVPWVALALALFRPDGALVGAGLVGVAALGADRRELARHTLAAAALGLGYFAWRVLYFGEWLPLPLLVKAQGGGGLEQNLAWGRSWVGPLGPLAALGVLLARAREGRPLLLLLPGLLLLAALAGAHQSQNVDWRFQAPMYTLLLVAAAAATRGLPRWGPVVLLAGVLPALVHGKIEFPRTYIDTVAARLGPALEGHRLAVTEAGRVPYWSDAETFDLVGLNTALTAHRPPTLDDLRALDPDVVFLHVAGTARPRRWPALQGRMGADPVVRLRPDSLDDALVVPSPRDPRHKIAAAVAQRYLAERDDMDVFVIRYAGRPVHLWGVRRELSDVTALLGAAHDLPYASYAELRAW